MSELTNRNLPARNLLIQL